MEFGPLSFDAVVLCELLETVDKNASLNLLQKTEEWAIKKVLKVAFWVFRVKDIERSGMR